MTDVHSDDTATPVAFLPVRLLDSAVVSLFEMLAEYAGPTHCREARAILPAETANDLLHSPAS